jgi:DNA-binding MarR family transcriptional regulator
LNRRNTNELSLQVLKKFRIIYGSVRQHFRDVEQSCGITGSQLWILHEIAGEPGIGVSELAIRLSIHQSTCSQLVEKLSVRNLVKKERSTEDQRRVGLHLTEEANAVLRQAPGPAEGLLPEALQSLPTEVLLSLDHNLVEVLGQLRNRDEKLADRPLADL